MHYLEETHPHTPLLGSSAKENALVAMWERRMELKGFAAVMETVRNNASGLKGRAIAGPHAYDGEQTDASWKVNDQHTVRAGFQVTAERNGSNTASSVLPALGSSDSSKNGAGIASTVQTGAGPGHARRAGRGDAPGAVLLRSQQGGQAGVTVEARPTQSFDSTVLATNATVWPSPINASSSMGLDMLTSSAVGD